MDHSTGLEITPPVVNLNLLTIHWPRVMTPTIMADPCEVSTTQADSKTYELTLNYRNNLSF